MRTTGGRALESIEGRANQEISDERRSAISDIQARIIEPRSISFEARLNDGRCSLPIVEEDGDMTDFLEDSELMGFMVDSQLRAETGSMHRDSLQQGSPQMDSLSRSSMQRDSFKNNSLHRDSFDTASQDMDSLNTSSVNRSSLHRSSQHRSSQPRSSFQRYNMDDPFNKAEEIGEGEATELDGTCTWASARTWTSSVSSSKGSSLKFLLEEFTSPPTTFVLPQDTFTMLMTSRAFRGTPFYFSLFIFSLQVFLLMLLLSDLLDSPPGTPFLNPPPDVSLNVRIAQFLAVPVAIAMQEDVLISVENLSNERLKLLFADNFAMYVVANLCRLAVGLLGLLVSFVIVIQSDNIIDLFKDFAAMAFISMLDDAAFRLAKNGFLNFGCGYRAFNGPKNALQREAIKIANLKVPRSIHGLRGRKRSMLNKYSRQTTAALLYATMTAGLLVFASKQRATEYLPSSLTVQFGDEEVYWLQAHSGIYDKWWFVFSFGNSKSKGLFKHSDRVVYRERNGNGELRGYFRYDAHGAHWIFSVESPKAKDPAELQGIVAFSPRSDSYDITAVDISEWQVYQNGNFVPLDHLSIYSNECSVSNDCNVGLMYQDRGFCDLQPDSPTYHKCVCAQQPGRNFFGPKCQFRGPCTRIEVADPSNGFVSFSSIYIMIPGQDIDTMPFGQPVYYYEYVDQRGEIQYADVIFFGGRRWFLVRIPLQVYELHGSLLFYFRTFHLSDNHYWLDEDLMDSCQYISEPTSGGAPINLHWFKWQGVWAETSYDTLTPTNIKTICADCSYSENGSDDPCMHGGTCNVPTSVCDCQDGYSGGRCQTPPLTGSLRKTVALDPRLSACTVCEPQEFTLGAFQEFLTEKLGINVRVNNQTLEIWLFDNLQEQIYADPHGDVKHVGRTYELTQFSNGTTRIERIPFMPSCDITSHSKQHSSPVCGDTVLTWQSTDNRTAHMYLQLDVAFTWTHLLP